ncbi:MAG: hypothetical protein KF770_10500 [Anaerolineae bacterium]|nr:hypothetical protein [Anaerolineae bacterium]
MYDEQPTANARYATLLVGLGIIWLLLAGGILVFQLFSQKQVKIEWETATEQNTAGFYLYRSLTPAGDFELITPEMIASAGSAVSGSSYSFIDSHVVAGETYYYLLEEIEYDSTTHRYVEDMISRQVPLLEWWAIIMVALALLVGIGLVVAGLREGGMT